MLTWIAKTAGAVAGRIISDARLYWFITFYCLCGVVLMQATGTIGNLNFGMYSGKFGLLFLILFPAIAILFDLLMVVVRFDRRRMLALKHTLSPKRFGHLMAGMALMMSLVFFMGTFTALKNSMFDWQGGFDHDVLIAAADRWLHMGVDPWVLVSPLVTNPLLRGIAEYSYSVVWFGTMFASLFFVATSVMTDTVRLRYFVSFMAVWIIIGNVMASMFLSSGPAFYGHVTGDDLRYADLLAYLAAGGQSGHSAAGMQAYLWASHISGDAQFGSGISAFPSVHVGLIAMNTMFAFEVSRKLGLVAATYTAFIIASSVALGWHYAVDGYASVAIVVVIHHALKWLFATPVAKTQINAVPALETKAS